MIAPWPAFRLMGLTLGIAAAGPEAAPARSPGSAIAFTRFPADRAKDVNPDTHLVLVFSEAPTIGASGQIRIYDAADDRLVDTLDLSIPPGPTERADAAALAAPYTTKPYEYIPGRFTNANTKPGTPSGVSRAGLSGYQLTIIGGFTDGFHFYPVIVRGNTATLYPHNNLLDYDKTYYVQIDPGVLSVPGRGFAGISGKSGWRFKTKKSPPRADTERLVVSADGAGDFNTVQGAIDFVPDRAEKRVTIFIRNGLYEEIVYFRNKSNITFLGEDREKVIVQYQNNEVFNPHPPDVSTNEVPGTFPSRRAAFMADNSTGIHFVNMTIQTTAKGQAEGLLLSGEKMIVSHVNIVGSGDALQTNGSAYYGDCFIRGDGDTILGRGAAFFERCSLESRGPFMWIRNTAANHGNVFVNSTFKGIGGTATFARAPINRGKAYPNAEAVLIDCALEGIRPEGWGDVGGDPSAIHYWEHNSRNLGDGTPVDVSQRHKASRQLSAETDAALIASYRNPGFVLGWTPAMAPLILTHPKPLTAAPGQEASFTVRSAAVPAPTYQWFKDDKPIEAATSATLILRNVSRKDIGAYSVTVANASGRTTSVKAKLAVARSEAPIH